jgi:acyl-CoA reductase-like NAD-dependent aldehyde dehydrogenase
MALETALIGGSRQAANGGATLASVNPANGEVIAEFAVGDAGAVDAAVASAQAAQREWWALHGRERARLLWTWGDLIERHAAELAELDVRDVGKVRTDALAEAGAAARAARYWSGAAERLIGQTIPTMPGHLSYTTREPLGVVGVILPWNGPTGTAVARVAPALTCGNAVVVKPSEYSPLSAFRVAELAIEAGMPAGLVNVVPGDGSTGALLADHGGVGGVSFTGSVPTGRKVAQAAVGHFAKALMELGGKAPNIVFADADLEAAISGSTWGIFHNAGQICVASSRLLVQEPVADRVVDAVAGQAERIRVGDPMKPGTHIGPIVSARQYERVVGYIDAGRDEGARLRTGGGTPEGVDAAGLYVSPTVFTDVDPGMRIASEEIFGPVLSVFTFRTEDEAIELANSLDYGLSANVWTRDLDRALGVAGQIQAGNVWVNSARVMDPSLPFGGLKNSGIGNANGFDVLEELTQTKRVSVNYGGAGPAWAGLG